MGATRAAAKAPLKDEPPGAGRGAVGRPWAQGSADVRPLWIHGLRVRGGWHPRGPLVDGAARTLRVLSALAPRPTA